MRTSRRFRGGSATATNRDTACAAAAAVTAPIDPDKADDGAGRKGRVSLQLHSPSVSVSVWCWTHQSARRELLLDAVSAARSAGPDVRLVDRHMHLRVLLLLRVGRVLVAVRRRMLPGRVGVGLLRLLRSVLLACTQTRQHKQKRRQPYRPIQWVNSERAMSGQCGDKWRSAGARHPSPRRLGATRSRCPGACVAVSVERPPGGGPYPCGGGGGICEYWPG